MFVALIIGSDWASWPGRFCWYKSSFQEHQSRPSSNDRSTDQLHTNENTWCPLHDVCKGSKLAAKLARLCSEYMLMLWLPQFLSVELTWWLALSCPQAVYKSYPLLHHALGTHSTHLERPQCSVAKEPLPSQLKPLQDQLLSKAVPGTWIRIQNHAAPWKSRNNKQSTHADVKEFIVFLADKHKNFFCLSCRQRVTNNALENQ